MAVAQQTDQAKPASPGSSDAPKVDHAGKADHAGKTDPARAMGDAAREGIAAAAERAPEPLAINPENLGRVAEFQEKAADNAQQVMQVGIEVGLETVTRNARAVSEQMARTFGFGGEEGERLAGQSRQNVEALARCGTVLSQACQDAWLNTFELGRRRWQRNIEGLNRLGRARSVQEFGMLQSEMMREGLQNLVHDTRTVAETSLRAFEEAGQICASVKPPAR